MLIFCKYSQIFINIRESTAGTNERGCYETGIVQKAVGGVSSTPFPADSLRAQ
jgi:hypothetical protein